MQLPFAVIRNLSPLCLMTALAACDTGNSSISDDAPHSTGGSGGSGGSGGGTGGSSGTMSTSVELGMGMQEGTGMSSEQYHTAQVTRDGVPYLLITNGWGPGFGSHTISWEGTSFVVENMMGSQGTNYEPASYPSVFCGKYSIAQVPDCGLPAAIDTLTSLVTGWRWAGNGNAGPYNAAYDIWLGNGTNLESYLMVWLRDPPGAQPAGSRNTSFQSIAVANVPGVWNVWNGTVNGRPIVNYARAEGSDIPEVEFDVLDFIDDARTRGLNLPGASVNAVAVGFEIWSGPVTNLASVDFYVDAQ